MKKTCLIRLAVLFLMIVAMTACSWSIGGERQGDDHREDKQKDTSDRR